jgi:hypothetical protein
VYSEIDVGCDGTLDHMYDSCSLATPLTWYERTTTPGAGEAYLLTIMPPYPWLFRHTADIDHVCFGAGQATSISVLNTVYESIPFSPGGSAFFATTMLGGAPNTPPSLICLDSPQNSWSETQVYHNPALKGNSGGPTGAGGRALDDASGLYVRWTAFMSFGSTSLQRYGDLRKGFQSPPSIASDTGYVERTTQLDCFWMDDNGCATCDANSDGVITPAESWNDPDLTALGGINAVDQDRDCLMAAGKTQPGWPTAAIDGDDVPNGVLCSPVPYSENPAVVQYDTSADSDCDGLLDGQEWAWGSNPLVADSDGDGAPDFVEMFQFTNPTVKDTDGDGFADKPAGTYGDNIDITVDNCPSVANPTQVNTDGHRRDNGPNLPGLWASNPNQDKLGDACDQDNDNDGAINGYETSIGTNPLLVDTDGDTVNDGAEARRLANGDLTADPLNAAKKPAWTNAEQVYYRGCHINVNDTDYPAFVPYLPSPSTHVEMDLDGDGVVCPTDADSDNGHANKTEILDKYEAYGYNLSITAADTDGDGCDDWVEVMDVNGDRTSDSGDQGRMNRRIAGLILPNAISDLVFDVNKDGFVDAGDQGSLNRNICSTTKNWGGCPVCGSEN